MAHLFSLLKQKYSLNVTLFHVNHGLQACANDWVSHCSHQAKKWQLTYASKAVSVKQLPRTSVEAQARNARYEALRQYCRDNQGILVIAHHLDDVMETFLLQLKRGAGPKGLSAMAWSLVVDDVIHFRPLLDVPQENLVEYLTAQQLDYIDDPSNNDQRFERNFIRHSLSPLLLERWPSFRQTLARSAKLCAQQNALIEQQAMVWLDCHLTPSNTLPLYELFILSQGWQQEILRFWCQTNSKQLPNESQLLVFLKALEAAEDKQPCLQFGSTVIRRYQGHLYIDLETDTAAGNLTPFIVIENVPVEITPLQLIVKVHESDEVFDNALFTFVLPNDAVVNLQLADPERKVSLPPNRTTRALKRFLKEWLIPPWQRKNVYILCVNGIDLAVLCPRRCVRISEKLPDYETAGSSKVSVCLSASN